MLAIGILVLVRRSPVTRPLTSLLVWSGIAGATLAALYVFMNATVPIAPYETGPGAWTPLLWNLLLLAFTGFGLGVIFVSILALPVTYFRNHRRKI